MGNQTKCNIYTYTAVTLGNFFILPDFPIHCKIIELSNQSSSISILAEHTFTCRKTTQKF